jgi:hypothetical protein
VQSAPRSEKSRPSWQQNSPYHTAGSRAGADTQPRSRKVIESETLFLRNMARDHAFRQPGGYATADHDPEKV